MATIKMTGKKEKQQLYMKIAAVVVLVLVAVGIFTLTGGDNDAAPKTPQVRSQETQLTHQEADTTEEGRLFTFELGNLKDGKTGTVTIRTRPSWAPIGVDQFHKLADSGFFDGCRFFRVVPNFIIQFGINGDPSVQQKWENRVLQDDPVVTSNKRGTLTFATSGPNTRTTQMFINTNKGGNKFLDGQGFSTIGEVIEGMDIVDQINDEYKEKPDQGMIENKGNKYLEAAFPKLSYIVSAKGSLK